MKNLNGKKIILFDGVCNLCNSSIQWIIKRDRKEAFLFASLQSEVGLKMTSERHIDIEKTDSIILIDPGTAYYIKSEAALEILRELGGIWSVLLVFRWLPSPIRDRIYDIVASHRYRWFGKKEACMVPTPDIKSRFID